MSNLYSVTKGQQAIRELYREMHNRTGNMPPLPGMFPDYADRQEHAGRPRAGDGALGHTVAGARTPRPQDGSGRDQHPQREVGALAPLAWRREPMPSAVHLAVLAATVADLRADLGQARSALDKALADRLADHGRAERAEAQAALLTEAARVDATRTAMLEAALAEARTPWVIRVINAMRGR